jgi:hypothetical protein
MDKLFSDLERLLEIEVLQTDLENACLVLAEDVDYEEDELRYAKIQLLSLESPDFFLRLMPARLEKKKELAQAEVRAHTAALEEARRALESRRFTIDTLKEEYQSLLPRREEYAAGAGSFPEDLEQHLVCASGIRLAERILHSLSQARNHMTGEARRGETTRGSQLLGNRKLEFLSKAAEDARKLQELLDHLPSSLQLKGSYLSWPDHYVTEPTTPYAQMDRLNMAVDTVRDVRNQLRELL